MPEISRKAELSRRYTNHCLRSTAITILDDNNFASRHIMAVSGHRAESSLKTYARHTSEETQRNMSHILANSTIGENIENIPPAVMEEVSDNTSSISVMDFEVLEIPDNILASVPMPNFHNAPQYVNCSVTVNYNFNR